MEKELQDELVDAEALALMQDNFLELESLVLAALRLFFCLLRDPPLSANDNIWTA